MKRFTLIDVPVDKNHVRDIHIKGTTLRGAAAPNDFPERLRVGIEESGTPARCRVFIDFIYPIPPDEEVESKSADGGSLFIGKRSGRILRLELPISPETKGATVRLEIMLPNVRSRLAELERLAQDLPEEERPPRRIAHYGALSELLPELAPAIETKLEQLRREMH